MSSPALQAAERKGYEARMSGKSERECPYQDHRGSGGNITWSRAFRRAWFRGWARADTDLRQHSFDFGEPNA